MLLSTRSSTARTVSWRALLRQGRVRLLDASHGPASHARRFDAARPLRRLRPKPVALPAQLAATHQRAVAPQHAPTDRHAGAEHVNLAADPAPTEPTVQRPAAPSRSWWTRAAASTRGPHSARAFSTRAPCKARGDQPAAFTFPTCASHFVTAADGEDDAKKTPALTRRRSCRGLGDDYAAQRLGGLRRPLRRRHGSDDEEEAHHAASTSSDRALRR